MPSSPLNLSPLEQDALSVLWQRKKMRVRDIYHDLKQRKHVALTSVAVIMDRLHSKGIVGRDVERARGGLRYQYYPLQDKKQLERSVIEKSVDALVQKFGRTAVSYFNERFGK